MTTLRVPITPKMLREALAAAQTHVTAPQSANLQRLIDECDRLRPLGSDGQHGDRHTAECGCEDKMGSSWQPLDTRSHFTLHSAPLCGARGEEQDALTLAGIQPTVSCPDCLAQIRSALS